ncbi:MAG: ATP-dependent Clp protease proteolytic subunit [Acutalibacteraceae bacterium]|nr:ATP-dependent Clp protease proteolytic subunit [Acutalibacteraceae bacterium]
MNSKNDGYYPQIQPDNNSDGDNATSVDQIRDFGSITAMNAENPIHCLTIIGQIEGHYILPQNSKATKYEHVIPALVAIEEEPAIKGLLVILNTVGGDVEAGLAIAELIAGMKKPVVSLVLGGGHSIGVPLSVAAKKSFIVPSATMTVHPVRMTGLVVGVPQTYSYFERMQDRIVKFICDNSKVSENDLRRMLHNTAELATDIGTVLSGEEAVKCGLIDEIGSLGDAIDCLNNMIEQQQNEQNDGAAEK